MKKVFDDLDVSWKAGDTVSKALAVVQAPILCLVVWLLAVWGSTADMIICIVVWVLGIAVVQAVRGIKNDAVDFKLFLDWFVINCIFASIAGMLFLSIVATISSNMGG